MYSKNSGRKVLVLNRYYRITRFYSFLKSLLLKALIVAAVVVAVLLLVNALVIDIELLLNQVFSNFSAPFIYGFFFISETVLGLVPPELFIAYAAKSDLPWMSLLLLATISYFGGVLSYLLGKHVSGYTFIRRYIDYKVKQHIENLKKWGSMFIVIGAVSPVPHSIVSMASGIINFSFSRYLLWSLFRFLRFLVYGIVIFNVL